MPTSFNPILKKLNLVYERNNSALDEAQENFSRFMLENVKNMSETKSWFFQFGYRGKLNDEILEYFVNDPFYKNKVFEYQIYYHNLSLQVVKLDAVKAYKALSEITGMKDGIDASIYFQTDKELSRYVGEFKINSDDSLFNEEKGYNVITFKVADGQLYAILFGKREIQIFPHAENAFILGDGDNAKFTFIQNKNGQITGFQLFNNSVYTDWTRIK